MNFRQARLAILGIGLAIVAPVTGFSQESLNDDQISGSGAQWWQWALSIPTNVNPLADPNGRDCMVGQRGPVWFLGGALFGGTVRRTCSVPEGKTTFFPLVNSINFNTPNVCGQGPNNLLVKEMRALSDAFVNGSGNFKVELDGRPVRNLRRLQSGVFAVALPENNIFDEACANLGGVPAGVYSPAVDEGIYVTLEPLRVGTHVLHFHAENSSQGFLLDVTYTLRVVNVLQR